MSLDTPRVDPTSAFDADELVLNMGPQHPSTHGVLRVVSAARRRTGHECRLRDRLCPSRCREAVREPRLDADHPAHGPDGLRRRSIEQPRLLRGGGKADAGRGAPPGAIHPNGVGRASADRQPLSVAGHARHGHRCHDGTDVRVSRAGVCARPVRGVLWRAADVQLDAGGWACRWTSRQAGTRRFSRSAT